MGIVYTVTMRPSHFVIGLVFCIGLTGCALQPEKLQNNTVIPMKEKEEAQQKKGEKNMIDDNRSADEIKEGIDNLQDEMKKVIKKIVMRRFAEFSTDLLPALCSVFQKNVDFILIATYKGKTLAHSASMPRELQMKALLDILEKLENQEGEVMISPSEHSFPGPESQDVH